MRAVYEDGKSTVYFVPSFVDGGRLHLARGDLAGEGVERQVPGVVGAEQRARHEEGDDGQDHHADDGAATLLAQEGTPAP